MLVRKGVKFEKKSDSVRILMVLSQQSYRARGGLRGGGLRAMPPKGQSPGANIPFPPYPSRVPWTCFGPLIAEVDFLAGFRAPREESGLRRTNQGPAGWIRARKTDQGPRNGSGPRMSNQGRKNKAGSRWTNQAAWRAAIHCFLRRLPLKRGVQTL